MMTRRKISILEANNGFIVKVINHGMTPFREPYGDTLMVFTSLKEMSDWLKRFFEEKEND